MKFSFKTPLFDNNDPIFTVPKHFRFVYHSNITDDSYYYRWPFNYFVSFYLKVYYWFIIKHVKKQGKIHKRRE